MPLDLRDHRYRRVTVKPGDFFPNFNQADFLKRFAKPLEGNHHQRILDVALSLWDGGYDDIISRYGFYAVDGKNFSGHCHQISPALGLVLKANGFERVAYLECFRAHPDTWEKIPPDEESSPYQRREFMAIGRIPYCCVEVEVGGEKFYLSGKHLKMVDGKPHALLRPISYRPMVGVLQHQDDQSRSGMYLATVREEPFTWMKQTYRDMLPEFFVTFAHMDLVL